MKSIGFPPKISKILQSPSPWHQISNTQLDPDRAQELLQKQRTCLRKVRSQPALGFACFSSKVLEFSACHWHISIYFRRLADHKRATWGRRLCRSVKKCWDLTSLWKDADWINTSLAQVCIMMSHFNVASTLSILQRPLFLNPMLDESTTGEHRSY